MMGFEEVTSADGLIRTEMRLPSNAGGGEVTAMTPSLRSLMGSERENRAMVSSSCGKFQGADPLLTPSSFDARNFFESVGFSMSRRAYCSL